MKEKERSGNKVGISLGWRSEQVVKGEIKTAEKESKSEETVGKLAPAGVDQRVR